MAAKLLVKLVFSTGSILARSIHLAYKQAILQAENGMGAAAAGFDIQSKMSPIEAKKILGLDNKQDISIEDIETKHKQLLDLNDPKLGGSEYLQIKISAAKLCLSNEIKNS